jgi:DNA-binding LacI/PurR family transcriptional regulator
MIGAKSSRSKHGGTVTLKAVAQYLGLTPGTVSAVLNDTKAARTIPETTRKRIVEAARHLNYQPNFLARSLRVKRTYTVGVIVEEIGDAYGSLIVGGIEPFLRESNFFFLTVAHRHDPKLLRTYSQLLTSRGVEGLITIDTSIEEEPDLPTVAVAGHQTVENVTNIILDHHRAAELALQYLKELGHEHTAFLRGLPKSSDSAARWEAIEDVAQKFGIQIRPELVLQIEGTESTPELGYPYGKALMDRKIPFTALFAYNDISALGAMRAFQEAGLRVPEDVSIIGFDDISIASYSVPSLTTIRQPLAKMGKIAAQTLLDRIEERTNFVPEIAVAPELIKRHSVVPSRSL